ncbi:MAG: S8 family serine peptidase, partial [Fimbriimonadaceae bacterium]|nr:S8 family serine peptidase [Fimbriimonadaceae bacterium]
MRLRLGFGIGMGVCAIAALGQTVTQSLALMGLAEESARRSSLQSEWVRRAARLSGEPIRQEFPDGSIIEWVGFDQAGWPFYVQTNNRVAAISVNTLPCWPGQVSGLSLDGTGVRLGIWDGGAVLATHQEFQGRVTLGNTGSSASHASHVAGTMIAGGVSASAIGMSPKATLRSYNWSNDTGEMASEAAGGLLLSNHSYGRVTGWNFSNNTWYWYGNPAVSESEDVAFGLYDEAARVWDTVAYNAPYYLIVKSAGNDRNDRPASQPTQHLVRVNGTWTESATVRDPDGGNDGYDSMSSYSLAKNILSVGAINDLPNGYSSPSSVVMTAFSGWGPADDGRIKPDIVANGTALSSSSNASISSYASLS